MNTTKAEMAVGRDEVNFRGNRGLVDAAELAELLKVRETWVYENLPEMPFVKVAGKYRFDFREVVDWLRR